MFAGIARLICLVVLSPFNSKYYFIPVAKEAVIISLIVTFRCLVAALTSLRRILEEDATSLLPVSFLLPSCKGLLSYFIDKYLRATLGR